VNLKKYNSGTQAIKALRREGYRVILVNSNPATIMTDPDLADATWIEPTTPEVLEAIIAQERPDALLPTVGRQTGLNLALALSESGVRARYGVTLQGASLEAIQAAEDRRRRFSDIMLAAGLPVPAGGPAHLLAEAEALAKQSGYPLLVRASFALGGSGASWVYQPAELAEAVRKAMAESPIGQAWIVQSIMGWKEYELEVMADRAGNFVVVCSIENLDPMGVHTGDSITVAPAQTLTDRDYQVLRDLAWPVMGAVGVQTGGANVQFAVDPRTGEAVIIEMNPRVSRSSALASKATGFPIAKIAALKIARDLKRLGFHLMATPGTADALRRAGLPVQTVNKVSQGSPHVVDAVRAGQVDLILNTPLGPRAQTDGLLIRQAATAMNVPLLTTLSAAAAAVAAIRALCEKDFRYRSLQAHYRQTRPQAVL
jgi:carbamoylphosphate synthase large subunit